jgi:putative component of membrane protein insertase Oxa1/YidC/SpoIIIJ protein YidD
MMSSLLISCIRAYQRISGALIAARFPLLVFSGCRSIPTCSEYTVQTIRARGPFVGLALGLWHVMNCNPFSPSRI